jgi:hypothetical protein
VIKIRCIVERITYQNPENGYTILTRIFRQAQTSRIIMNAHMINQGKMPDTSNGNDTDFFFVPVGEAEEAVA